jgi:hypothetical protein
LAVASVESARKQILSFVFLRDWWKANPTGSFKIHPIYTKVPGIHSKWFRSRSLVHQKRHIIETSFEYWLILHFVLFKHDMHTFVYQILVPGGFDALGKKLLSACWESAQTTYTACWLFRFLLVVLFLLYTTCTTCKINKYSSQ